MIYGAPPIVTNGLILHLDAANTVSYPGSGTIWRDLSGRGNNGTLVNNTSLIGNVMSFDGTDDHVLVGSGSDYNSLSNLTIESVVKFKRSSFYEYVVSNARDCCGTYNGFELRYQPNSITFTIWNGTAATLFATGGVIFDIFYHITATYDGASMRLYINSILNNSTNTTLGIGSPASYPLRIGAMGLSQIYELQGEIGFVKIYNRALNQQEITQNYNSTKSRFGLS